MSIVALLGSPRNGNSTAIALRLLENIGSSRTKIYQLNDLSYRGCQACLACKKSLDHCAIRDELSDVLDAVKKADTLVLATPVYYGDVSAQLKAFIDRTFSYYTPDFRTSANPSRLSPGKKLVFIQTQGYPDETFYADLFPRYVTFFKRYGFTEAHLIRGIGVSEPNDALQHEDVVRQIGRVAAAISRPRG